MAPVLLIVWSVAIVGSTRRGTADTAVFINEVHYDNAGADTGEGVEVAGPAGTDLAGYSIRPYNGLDGATYGSIVDLSGVVPDQDDGFGVLWFPVAGLQNGSPDGLALLDSSGAVVQFVSYEGTITATSGPATGMTSQDIGVSEAGTEPPGQSLQLAGIGAAYADFLWAGPVGHSTGAVNVAQDFETPAPPPLPALSIDDLTVAEGDAGAADAAFTVTLSEPAASGVTVDFATADGTATAPDDYSATAGTLSLEPGATSGQIVVPVSGDTTDEADETFAVVLSAASGATIADGVAEGTITDDDEVSGSACTITGTAGNDVLLGTPQDDVICGLEGDDSVRAEGGNDLVLGGGGDDRLLGGPGDDDLMGEGGDDELVGNPGNDHLEGGEGTDRLKAHDGVAANDVLDGGPDTDRCRSDPEDVLIDC
jgi:Ca2+-binding RTX toxin-like protein